LIDYKKRIINYQIYGVNRNKKQTYAGNDMKKSFIQLIVEYKMVFYSGKDNS